MTELTCDVAVLGGGPGGYTAAIRAGQRGLSAVLVDRGGVGGTCLRVGCIPSKALIHVADEYAAAARAFGGSPIGVQVEGASIDLKVAQQWKDDVVGQLTGGVAGLLGRAGVTVVDGWASVEDDRTLLVETDDGPVQVRAEHLVLATGSVPVELPTLPFGGPVLSSTEVLSLTDVPERLCVVGAGYIGVELGTVYAKLGSAVTFVEETDTILPGFDPRLSQPVRRRLDELGVVVHTGARATEYTDGTLRAVADGAEAEVEADAVLVAVGRRPLVDGWGLERLPVERDGRYVAVDDRGATSVSGVWAVGDLTGEPMLAHRAIAQAEVVVDAIAGGTDRWDHTVVPSVVYCDPPIVSVGMALDEARVSCGEVVEGRFPFTANGRALGSADTAGFVQVVARADDHAVLGVHAVGADVVELAASFALAIEMQARLEDVVATIHAHPTRSEAFAEAALVALVRPLHV